MSKLAVSVHRRPEDTRVLGGLGSVWGKGILLLLIIVALVAHLTGFVGQMLRFLNSHAEVAIPREKWRALYVDDKSEQSCHAVLPQKVECFGSPENPALWTSPYRREDKLHAERAQQRAGSTYWIGAIIEPQDLAKAHAASANQLIVGYLLGGHEVWIDGERVFKGTYKDIHFPLVVGISSARLAEPRGLYVAIKIQHNAGAVYPDLLAMFRQEGLATSIQADDYLRAEVFEDHIRPWFFFGVYFVLGMTFLMLWVCNFRKQECAYLAAYALFQSLIQALNGDYAADFMDLGMWNRLANVLSIYEGAFALFLGLAFARFRPVFFQWGIPAFLATGWAIFFLVPNPVSAASLNFYLAAKVVPRCYLLGAVACFLQSMLLEERSQKKGVFTIRSRRLLMFGIGLCGIGIGYGLQESAPAFTYYMVWPRFLNLGLVLYLSAVVLRDYREAEKILERAPLSTYHRRSSLPSRLSGVLLAIDMKQSEFLIRAGSALGNSGELVNTGLSHVWAAVASEDGTVLATEGDALTVFFDHDAPGDAMVRAVQAVEKVALNLEAFSEQLLDRSVMKNDWGLIKFRAAITQGDIQPIWQEIKGQRYAGWIAAGSTNSFLEAARLLELEQQIDPSRNSSIVVMPESIAAMLDDRVSVSRWPWVLRASSMIAKHGDTYHVAAMAVGGVRFAYEKAVSL